MASFIVRESRADDLYLKTQLSFDFIGFLVADIIESQDRVLCHLVTFLVFVLPELMIRRRALDRFALLRLFCLRPH